MQITPVDLKDPELYRDGIPHQIFTQLRRDAPVSWNPEADGRGFWTVTRYDDIVAVSKAPKVFSSAREHGGHRMFDENVVGVAGLGAKQAEALMISMDPPRHNQYRRMLSPGLAHVQVLCTATKPAMNAGEIRLRLIRCSQIAR
jgi:linalool 8-monooxygenase